MKAFIPTELFLSPRTVLQSYNNLLRSVVAGLTVHFPQSCLNWCFRQKVQVSMRAVPAGLSEEVAAVLPLALPSTQKGPFTIPKPQRCNSAC